MNAITEIIEDLSKITGVKGCAVVTSDGIMVASELAERFPEDVVAGLTSFLISTTRRSLAEGGLGRFRRFVMNCTHGKVVLCDAGDACLVALTDQFARIEDCLPAIEAASERLRDVVKIQL